MNMTIEEIIEEINELFEKHLDVIRTNHHKTKDGIWVIEVDAWTGEYHVYHNGYVLDKIETNNVILERALNDFLQELKKRMDAELV